MSIVGLIGIVVVVLIIGALIFSAQSSLGGIGNNSMRELLENQIISEEQAEKIRLYYREKKDNSNIGVVIISIVGIILIVLGIILVVAYNWNTIPKAIKLSISILILLIAQGIFFYHVYKKKTSLLAIEGSSIFLAGMIAATIALIGQIYNIPGSFEGFMFTWMILVLPIPYIYNSALTAILYLIGIVLWFFSGNYYGQIDTSIFSNFLMVLLIYPYIIHFIVKMGDSIRTKILELGMFISFMICFMQILDKTNDILNPVLAFNALLISIYFISSFFKRLNMQHTKVLAQLSITIQMLVLVFISKDINMEHMNDLIINKNIMGNSIAIFILITALSGFYYFVRNKQYENVVYALTTSVIAIFSYSFSGMYLFYAVNVYTIGLAIYLILNANISKNLYRLNIGLVITIILVLKWFVDSGFGTIERATGFIVLGILLILVNLKVAKDKRGVKKDVEAEKLV